MDCSRYTQQSRRSDYPFNTQNPPNPPLSFVVDDFLKRYDPNNKATLTKLKATLPILLTLVDDKPINQIFQTDLNHFFDEVQKLPVRRDAGIFQGMSIRQIIEANTGSCISAGTFKSTYRACVSLFIEWGKVQAYLVWAELCALTYRLVAYVAVKLLFRFLNNINSDRGFFKRMALTKSSFEKCKSKQNIQFNLKE